MREAPFDHAYWVDSGLLAGATPGDLSENIRRWNIRRLWEEGISVIINLTEPHEVRTNGRNLEDYDYMPALEWLCRERGLRLLHFGYGVELTPDVWRSDFNVWRCPIRDLSVPSVSQMEYIQEVIHQAIERERGVYVHCRAGVGRTGTVVGCYLIEQGLHPKLAESRIQRKRQIYDVSTLHVRSPEMISQVRFVENWRRTVD